jgi:putative CocE/NonD family hydrolase
MPTPSTSQGSQQQYGVLIDRDVTIPARDGTPLATSLYYPSLDGRRAPGSFPTLIERTPYDRHRLFLHLTASFFARRGYVVALQDVRGRGDSGGDFYYLYNQNDEGNDGFDAVEWLAAQEWSDGKVGTIGLSYTGATQQALAVRRPPHLVTQFVMDTGWNYFLRPTRHGGAFGPGLHVPYIFRLAKTGKEAQQDPAVKRLLFEAHANSAEWLKHYPLRRGATPLRFAPTYEGWFFDLATKGDYGDFWVNPGGNLSEFVDDYPDIPLFFLSSWYGHHPWANFVKYNELKRRHQQPIRLMVGTWVHSYDMLAVTHAGEVDFGHAAAVGDLNSLRLKWFDHWMKGYETDVMDGPPIDLFIMGGGSGLKNPEGRMEHGGAWRQVEQWPLPETQFTTYYCHADGTLSTERPGPNEPPSTYTYNPADPVPTLGGNFQDPGLPGICYGGAFDQRGHQDLIFCKDEFPLAMRPDVLVFQTPPLEEAVEITGPIAVKLWISSSAVDTDFTAKLLDVYPPNDDYPDGFAMNLADSIIRTRYRNGFERQDFIEPGQVYELTVEPQPTANRFLPGHRIRLDISSSNFPQFDPNPNSGEPLGQERRRQVAHQTIYHDAEHPSHVVLPVIPRG